MERVARMNGQAEAIARISPELALVDPDLGRRLRRTLRNRPARVSPPLPVLHVQPSALEVGTAARSLSAPSAA